MQIRRNFISIEEATSNESLSLSLCVCVRLCVYVCSVMLNTGVPMETFLLVNES